MPFDIQIEDSGVRFRCADDETVLRGMECLGLRGIPVGCRGGGCGICKVRVVSGQYRTLKMSRAVMTADEEQQRCALACRMYAESDLHLQAIGKMQRVLLSNMNSKRTSQAS